MRAVIVSGGNIDRDFALAFFGKEHFDIIIGVDNGLRFLYENGILPTHIVGDFDTADPKLVNYYRERPEIDIRTFNPVKDSTDTEIAIRRALELCCTRITILGGTGTRLDHVLGNIQSLMIPREAGVRCEILDPNNRIRLIGEPFSIKREEQYGKYISLIPLTSKVEGVSLTGFQYPLTDYTFTSTGSASLGVSNELLEDEGHIYLRSGILILIESRD